MRVNPIGGGQGKRDVKNNFNDNPSFKWDTLKNHCVITQTEMLTVKGDWAFLGQIQWLQIFLKLISYILSSLFFRFNVALWS